MFPLDKTHCGPFLGGLEEGIPNESSLATDDNSSLSEVGTMDTVQVLDGRNSSIPDQAMIVFFSEVQRWGYEPRQ